MFVDQLFSSYMIFILCFSLFFKTIESFIFWPRGALRKLFFFSGLSKVRSTREIDFGSFGEKEVRALLKHNTEI